MLFGSTHSLRLTCEMFFVIAKALVHEARKSTLWRSFPTSHPMNPPPSPHPHLCDSLPTSWLLAVVSRLHSPSRAWSESRVVNIVNWGRFLNMMKIGDLISIIKVTQDIRADFPGQGWGTECPPLRCASCAPYPTQHAAAQGGWPEINTTTLRRLLYMLISSFHAYCSATESHLECSSGVDLNHVSRHVNTTRC